MRPSTLLLPAAFTNKLSSTKLERIDMCDITPGNM
jgi:hypothetical protein